MALRIKTAIRIAPLLFTVAAAAQTAGMHYQVRHQHWRKGAPGTLTFTADGVTFEEQGKQAKQHSRTWKYEDIQQLELAPNRLRILTYEDQRWELGRDRDYAFDQLPKD